HLGCNSLHEPILPPSLRRGSTPGRFGQNSSHAPDARAGSESKARRRSRLLRPFRFQHLTQNRAQGQRLARARGWLLSAQYWLQTQYLVEGSLVSDKTSLQKPEP